MNIAVILAGGVGSRLGLEKPKQFMKMAGKTILEHTVDVFQKHDKIDEIVIVMNASYLHDAEEMVLQNHWTKVKKVLNGGSERYESSLVAINAYRNAVGLDSVNFIFHDAVRPMVSKRIINETIIALETYDAVDVAIPSADTIIKLDESKEFIAEIPKREYLNRGQTPQGFKYKTISEAYRFALQDPNMQTTDDCGIVKKYLPETKVYVVKGEEQNVKLTYPEDIYVLDKLFQIKCAEPDTNVSFVNFKDKVMVVFGGNSGIGLDMVKMAQANGAKCYAYSRSLTNTDISKTEDVEKAMQEVYAKENCIDYVVNSAAILNKEPIMHLNENTINQIIDINYKGMVNVTVAAYKYIKESKGQILHFTSSSYVFGFCNSICSRFGRR